MGTKLKSERGRGRPRREPVFRGGTKLGRAPIGLGPPAGYESGVTMADELGVTRMTVHLWGENGVVRRVRRGRRWYYSRADVVKAAAPQVGTVGQG